MRSVCYSSLMMVVLVNNENVNNNHRNNNNNRLEFGSYVHRNRPCFRSNRFSFSLVRSK